MKEGDRFLDSLLLMDNEWRIRMIKNHRGHVYVFREHGHPIKEIQFFDGTGWYDTVEGARFDQIRPWRLVS